MDANPEGQRAATVTDTQAIATRDVPASASLASASLASIERASAPPTVTTWQAETVSEVLVKVLDGCSTNGRCHV